MKLGTLVIAFCASFALGIFALKSPEQLMAAQWDASGVQQVAGASGEALDGVADYMGRPTGAEERKPFTNLLRLPEEGLEIRYDDSVSLEPLSSGRVTKIGYGRQSDVNVVTTSTGTYSTDGLKSAHVQYPGITVHERSHPRDARIWVHAHRAWFSLPLNRDAGSSFVYYGRMQGGGTYITGGGSSCFVGDGFAGCI